MAFRGPTESEMSFIDTTPEQQASGERVFVSVTHRIERPAALVFYAIGGYIGLLAAAAWGVFTFIRSHSA